MPDAPPSSPRSAHDSADNHWRLTTKLYICRLYDVPRRKNKSPQTEAVLVALLGSTPGWAYGYELCKETGLKSGTLYPILIRLHDQGLLEDGWEDAVEPGRPRRHTYRLTSEGLRLAEAVEERSKLKAGSRPSAQAVS